MKKKKIKCEVWFQPKDSEDIVNGLMWDTRLRLLKDDHSLTLYSFGNTIFTCTCCWGWGLFNLKDKRIAMHKYDKEENNPKAILVASWYE